MIKMRQLFVLCLLIISAFSCTKDDEQSASEFEDLVTDVYTVGYEDEGTTRSAKLWKNGIATSLTDGGNKTTANSLFVSGNDVYVVGTGSNGVDDIGMIWKNGVPIKLTERLRSYANSVFVSGSDVYVLGYISNGTTSIATVWKNEESMNLFDGIESIDLNSIFPLRLILPRRWFFFV